MNRHTAITSKAACVVLDGAVYYVTPKGGVFLELGARQGAPYVRRCKATTMERVRAVVAEHAAVAVEKSSAYQGFAEVTA